jgi:hypothetical protein
MAPDVRVGPLQGFDEAQSGSLSVFGDLVRKCIFDILPGRLARNDGLGLHDRLRVLPVALVAPRTRSRKPSK